MNVPIIIKFAFSLFKIFLITDGYTLMWKKGKDILSLGDNLMKRDKRYNLVKGKNGNTLVIRLAESSDAGEFECELPSNDRPSTIRHNIGVRGMLLSKNRLPAIMSWINIDQVGEREFS